jgi:UDP-N-acetylmuramoyl-tripeptide--D-alanyl-D-alanine ligase
MEYFSIVMSFLIIIILTNNQLRIYQQSQYHFSGFRKILPYFYLQNRSYLLLPLIAFCFYMQLWYIQMATGIYLLILILIKMREKAIVKLKYTARIRRLYFLIILVMTVFGTLASVLLPIPQLATTILLALFLSPFLIFIAAAIAWPLELLISVYYQLRAKMKLRRYGTEIIGITGSYGKTTTKAILLSYLQGKYLTIATPKSYNTLNGVSKSINENLEKQHEIMIVEMGATGNKDIEHLVKLTKPQYGIITTVGPQHLSGFKTVANILSEKVKLIDSLPKKGIAVINYDNQLLREYRFQSPCRKITFGLNAGADYRAYDLVSGLDGLSFKISFRGRTAEMRTKLIGSHNVYNILAAFALATEMGVSVKELIHQTRGLEPVKNRLNIHESGALTIIEDSFNANPEGFGSALEVLNYHKKYKILITPGLVEGGKEEEELNRSLSKKISAVCNLVILIKTRGSQAIKTGLDTLGFTNYIFVENFHQAMAIVRNEYPDAAVLIENDVTDIYLI